MRHHGGKDRPVMYWSKSLGKRNATMTRRSTSNQNGSAKHRLDYYGSKHVPNAVATTVHSTKSQHARWTKWKRTQKSVRGSSIDTVRFNLVNIWYLADIFYNMGALHIHLQIRHQ